MRDASDQQIQFAKLELAWDMVGCGQYDKAAQLATDILSADPECLGALHIYARCLIQKGKHKEAMQIVANLRRTDPENDDADFLESKIHYRNGDLTNALIQIKSAIKKEPEESLYLGTAAQYAAEARQLTDAKTFMRQCLHIDPTSPEGLSARIGISLAEEKTKRAKILAKEFLSQRPDDSHAHLLLATIYAKLQKYDQAKRCYSRALTLNPMNKRAETGLQTLISLRFVIPRLFSRLIKSCGLVIKYTRSLFFLLGLLTLIPACFFGSEGIGKYSSYILAGTTVGIIFPYIIINISAYIISAHAPILLRQVKWATIYWGALLTVATTGLILVYLLDHIALCLPIHILLVGHVLTFKLTGYGRAATLLAIAIMTLLIADLIYLASLATDSTEGTKGMWSHWLHVSIPLLFASVPIISYLCVRLRKSYESS